jgi:hypothetical protein
MHARKCAFRDGASETAHLSRTYLSETFRNSAKLNIFAETRNRRPGVFVFAHCETAAEIGTTFSAGSPSVMSCAIRCECARLTWL